MAEGGGLLNRYTVNSRIVGSNPIPSATSGIRQWPYPFAAIQESKSYQGVGATRRLDGLDPIEVRKAARLSAQLGASKAVTFKDCAKRYIAAHRPPWRNSKHAAQ